MVYESELQRWHLNTLYSVGERVGALTETAHDKCAVLLHLAPFPSKQHFSQTMQRNLYARIKIKCNIQTRCSDFDISLKHSRRNKQPNTTNMLHMVHIQKMCKDQLHRA